MISEHQKTIETVPQRLYCNCDCHVTLFNVFATAYMPCGVGHITKNSANVFSACRKRRLKETGRGDWESPPLYIFPQRQHEREGQPCGRGSRGDGICEAT